MPHHAEVPVPQKTHIKSTMYAIGLVLLVRWLVIEPYEVQGWSMEKTLLSGDCVLISKLHYGACTPMTLLKIGLKREKIFGIIPSYLNWIQLPSYRLPGFTHIQRGDIVMMAPPIDMPDPIDVRTTYIKRCVAIPQDKLLLQDGKVQVKPNGAQDYILQDWPKVQQRYYLKLHSALPTYFFSKHGIWQYTAVSGGYWIYATKQEANNILQDLKALAQTRDAILEFLPEPAQYPSTELLIPYKGWAMPVNKENLANYKDLIIRHEGNHQVRIQDDELWIQDEPIKTYVFKQDYYFVLGDNREHSEDSRSFGLVPKNHIFGKAVLIHFSHNPEKGIFSFTKVRWTRMFHNITSMPSPS